MLVCENHPDKAWPDECDCGAGMLSKKQEIMRAVLRDLKLRNEQQDWEEALRMNATNG